jgi:16S rRNA (guanine(527)-N(7))-methyltransferase GidB
MSELFVRELRAGIEKLSLTFDNQALERFRQFFLLLQKWNRVYNLTAIHAPEAILTHHFLDSLAIIDTLEQELARREIQATRILDVGSGGGFPGMMLAIAHPHWHITMIDAVAKKMAFVQQAIIELNLENAQAESGRVEEYKPSMRYHLVTARAFAEMHVLVEKTEALVEKNGVWVAMKGQYPEQEIAQLPASVHVVRVQPLTVPGLDAERHLVLLEKTVE